ncbi:RHS repeat-associated core domain-containing protein [Dictyobacter arantiisoli]|uniref:Type IV secretion protein Rhs n=1 Tax=Dictyobacter arantiisoli TaxID=2014874 RepID=A0A5A5T9E0_9CHLR|nr:RHS repeat-associated core domain-containing protein [Dictyobacter arantiisoli]GCF07609.1 hypothetical protein KDI_11730 [Dictyobacter arantiisoli]
MATGTTNLNGQTTTTSLSYDSNGNEVEQTSSPGETGAYTAQTTTNSTCTDSSTTPCYEVDTASSLYPNAVTRVYYDSAGRAVETRSPLDASNDLISFTIYNEINRTDFAGQSFRYPRGTTWVDPNTATIDNVSGGVQTTGTTRLYDPLGRTQAILDPIAGTSQEPGVPCPYFGGTWTACSTYDIGSPNGDTSTYGYIETLDANNQMSVAYQDVFGHTRSVQSYRVASADLTSNISAKTETQFNAIGLPTRVIVTDLTPQTGEDTTSVTTTASYDDMGRLTQLNDPDRGTTQYTYDADGRAIIVTSGSHTVGTSYDLLGRVGCVQDAAPTTDGSGTCRSGSHPLEQYTYGVSKLGVAGSTDFPNGLLTQDISTTYYPDGTSSQTTSQYQHDNRGRAIAETMQLSVPSSWNVSTALPTYQETQSYNDAGQPMTTQTTINGQPGTIFSQAYDATTGLLTGLSNNAVGAANLASLSLNGNGLTSAINYQTSTGTALATEQFAYDGNLRAVGATATWQAGSGTSGTIYSENRSYDPVGNVSSTSTTYAAVPGQSSSGGSETQNYCYDELNHLVWAGNTGTQPAAITGGSCGSAATQSGLPGASYSTNFADTHLGQLWQGPLNGAGASLQYLYCDATHPHQLTGIYAAGTTCATKNDGSASYLAGYDAWGNQTSRTYNGTTAALSYDVQNELVQWDAGSTSREWYAYDNSGERTLRRSTTASGTTLTVYAFGLEEHTYDSSGNATGNTYYYSLGGHLLGKSDGTTTQFYLTDGLGSVVETMTNTANAATVLGNQTYSPYGSQRYSQGSMGTDKGFTGQHADTTGLDYYNARYYDPVVGQFTAADTVEGNLQGMDPYTYVAGNPTTNTDPSGQRIDWGDGERSIVNWKTHTSITTESETSTWGEVIDSWGGGQVTTTCVLGCGGSRPWYDSPSSAYISSYVNTHWSVRHATPPARKAPARPKPKPKPPATDCNAVCQIIKIFTKPQSDSASPSISPGCLVASILSGCGGSASAGDDDGNYLYRALRPDEDPSKGLSPDNYKNVTAKTIYETVKYGSKSWFKGPLISTTDSEQVALTRFGGKPGDRIIKIDKRLLNPDDLYDVSTEATAGKYLPPGSVPYNNAVTAQEVLVRGDIPSSAIVELMTIPDGGVMDDPEILP